MKHTFKFLVSDGNGAASRGFEIDNYSTYTIKAETEKEAYNKLVLKIKGYTSVRKMILDENYGVDLVSELTPEEKAEFKEIIANYDGKAYLKSLDITGGDPWVEGLKVDGKTVIRPDWENMACYGYRFVDGSYRLWHLPKTAEDEFE